MNRSDIDPAGLKAMSLTELRALWSGRYGPAPSTRSPEILAHMLAWRVQGERDGGLTPELRRQLRRPGAAPVANKLTPGTRLTREWQGQVHEVVVEPDGRFRHDGRLHRSLSQVARTIAGTRWNGPRFFGLRDEEAGA